MGKTEQAISKFKELLRNGLVPDATTYNTIIHVYCKEGKVEKAFELHNKMVEKSLKPDVFTCNILLSGLCSNGMLEKALKLFNTWISEGKAIDQVTYNTMISGLCKEGRLEDAFHLVSEMKERSLGPDPYTYSSILGALASAGRMNEAEEFMSKMVEVENFGEQSLQLKEQNVKTSEITEAYDPDSNACSEQIIELCNQGRYKDAMRIFEASNQKGVTLNKSTYIVLMEGLIKRRKRLSKAVQ